MSSSGLCWALTDCSELPESAEYPHNYSMNGIRDNATGYFLLVLSLACIVYGHRFGDADMAKIGDGLLYAALAATHILPGRTSDPSIKS